MKTQNSGFFWPSFADLMTSLFFIMLVLYILTYLKLSNQQRATKEQLNKIKEIQSAVRELPREYFEYDSKYKRFSLVQNIQFAMSKSDIQQKDVNYLINVGESIKGLIDKLKQEYSNQDIKYLVVIEGMASRDNYIYNNSLSYERALAVQTLWQEKGIMPDPEVCEVQVAGSGTGGIGRYPKIHEWKNQRILIQIVPKIGQIN